MKAVIYELGWLESILNTHALTDEGKIWMLKENLRIRKEKGEIKNVL